MKTKSKKLFFVYSMLLMMIAFCYMEVQALTTLEPRFKVILANKNSHSKPLYVDLTDNVSVTENPSVRYYCTEDERGTVYNTIAPSSGTQLLWHDPKTGKQKYWYSMGGTVSGEWTNNKKSVIQFNNTDVTATTPFVRLPKVSKTGHTFTGWSITEKQTAYYYYNGKIRSSSGSSSVTYKNGYYEVQVGMYSNALTVKPNFTINICNVTFSDGLGNMLKTQKVNYGSNATPPANPTREGYMFNGWDGSYNNVTSNRTITAKWLPIKVDVTIPENLNIHQVSGSNHLNIDSLDLTNHSAGITDISRIHLDMNGLLLVSKDTDFRKMSIDTKQAYLEYSGHDLRNDYTQQISILPNKSFSIQLNGKMGISSYSTTLENIGNIHLTMRIRGQ